MKYLISILFFLSVTFGQAQERWVTLVQGWTTVKAIEYNDSYLSFGLGLNGGISNHKYQFNSISKSGNLISNWDFKIDTTFATTNIGKASSVISHSNGSVLIGGFIEHNSSFNFQPMLFNFKPDLSDTIKTKYWDYSDDGIIHAITEVDPNKLMIGSQVQRLSDSQIISVLQETDLDGNIAWRQEFECAGDCEMNPYQILELPDGGFFYTNEAGYINGNPGTDYIEAMLIRTDANGNELWRKTFGDASYNNQRPHVVALDNGNYMMIWSELDEAGYPNQGNSHSSLWSTEIDIDGNIKWQKDYYIDLLPFKHPAVTRQSIYISDYNLLSDGSIVVTGRVTSYHHYLFILKMDQKGNLIWYRQHEILPDNEITGDYKGPSNIYGLTQTSDGGYIVAGEYISEPSTMFPSGIQSGVVIKLDEYGCLEPDCQLVGLEEQEVANLSIYPNPNNGNFTIRLGSGKVSQLQLFDVMGKLVRDLSLNLNQDTIELNGIENGVYILKADNTSYQVVVAE